MPKRDSRATEGQRFPLRVSVNFPGRDGPENVMLSTELYNALEKAARREDRPMSNYLRVLAVKDVEAKGLYDREKDADRLSQIIHMAAKLDDRTMSNYLRSIVTRDLAEKRLYDPEKALFDNERAEAGKTKPDRRRQPPTRRRS